MSENKNTNVAKETGETSPSSSVQILYLSDKCCFPQVLNLNLPDQCGVTITPGELHCDGHKELKKKIEEEAGKEQIARDYN